MYGITFALAMSAVGIDYGWRPLETGGVEYIIQIQPVFLAELESGQPIVSEIHPDARDVRRVRIQVGSGVLPRQNAASGGLFSPAPAAAQQPTQASPPTQFGLPREPASQLPQPAPQFQQPAAQFQQPAASSTQQGSPRQQGLPQQLAPLPALQTPFGTDPRLGGAQQAPLNQAPLNQAPLQQPAPDAAQWLRDPVGQAAQAAQDAADQALRTIEKSGQEAANDLDQRLRQQTQSALDASEDFLRQKLPAAPTQATQPQTAQPQATQPQTTRPTLDAMQERLRQQAESALDAGASLFQQAPGGWQGQPQQALPQQGQPQQGLPQQPQGLPQQQPVGGEFPRLPAQLPPLGSSDAASAQTLPPLNLQWPQQPAGGQEPAPRQEPAPQQQPAAREPALPPPPVEVQFRGNDELAPKVDRLAQDSRYLPYQAHAQLAQSTLGGRSGWDSKATAPTQTQFSGQPRLGGATDTSGQASGQRAPMLKASTNLLPDTSASKSLPDSRTSAFSDQSTAFANRTAGYNPQDYSSRVEQTSGQSPTASKGAGDPFARNTPAQTTPTDEAPPNNSLLYTTLMLFASLGGNAYLGWITYGVCKKYRDLLDDLRETRAATA